MTSTGSRRLARGLAAVAVGSLAVLSLSGCLSMTADLSINSDAKTSGTFAIGVQKQAASMLGMTDLDAFKSGLSDPSMTEGSGDLLTTGDCVASETDAEFVYTCSFTDTEFTAADNPWTITKSGDTITFHMVNQAGDSQSTDLLGGGSLGQLTVKAAFPGEITSVTGDKVTKDSDTSITISAPMSDAVDVTVMSKASGGGGGAIGKILLIVGIALLVLIVIAIIAMLVMRGRKSEPAAPVAAAAGTGAMMAAPVVAETVVAEPVVEETVVAEPVVEETVVVEDATDGTREQGPEQA